MDLFVSCSQCGRSYAALLLPEEARCRCGAFLEQGATSLAEALRQEEAALTELRRLAERVSFLIVATDTPRVDVDIQRAQLRRRCAELFPDKMHVYDLVYESRFQRLWEQFRAA